MIFNWVPTRNLFVTDPYGDRILALDVSDEETQPQPLFQASNIHYISSSTFDVRIDIAPAVPEAASRNFASNTTLGGGSDFYVLNRGDNSIVRMTRAGRSLRYDRLSLPMPKDFASTVWPSQTMPGGSG
jgi:hypothetical protein